MTKAEMESQWTAYNSLMQLARQEIQAERFQAVLAVAIQAWPFIDGMMQYAKRVEAINWIQIDVDPLKADFPMWGFPTDIRIQGDCATVLQQVCPNTVER